MNIANTGNIRWEFHRFDSLSPQALFKLLKLRVDVFVVEQRCAYPELDDYDTAPDTWHFLGYINTRLVAYARAMPVDTTPVPTSITITRAIRIGRVVVNQSQRGTGVAQALMKTVLDRLDHEYPNCPQILGAQNAVACFYAEQGFRRVSDVYLEDDIAHVEMLRDNASSSST